MTEQVFISYSRKDHLFASKLSKDLVDNKIKIWTDTQILPGENWQKSIESNLLNSKFILFLISHESIKSTWTTYELKVAIDKGVKVIPLIIEKIDPSIIPSYIRNIQWIDFTESYSESLLKLISQLPKELKSEISIKERPPLNKGYAFISYAIEDLDFVVDLKQFLKEKGYAFWDYTESDRNYQIQFPEELEMNISNARATLSVISESWKKSNWAKKEFIFSDEVGVPVFLLKANLIGPTLLLAGMTYIDFTQSKTIGFDNLNKELIKRGL